MMVAQIDKNYRSYGYGFTLRRYLSYGLFEGRPVTTKGQWFNKVVFSWLRTFGAIPSKSIVTQPIFITGLGRSGTTILGVILSLHKDVGFLNEPKAMWHVIDPRQDVNGNYGGIGVRFRMNAEDVSSEIIERAHKVYGRYLSTIRASRVVDKYPELIFRVGYVRQIFPDSKFIFIYRNGIDACQSIVNWSQRLGVNKRGHIEDWWGKSDSKWMNLWNELILPSSDYKEVADLGPEIIDYQNRAALEWIVTMREGMSQSQIHGNRIIKIRYEDLLADPQHELAKLMKGCSLENDERVFDYAHKSLYKNPSKQLPNLIPPIQSLFDSTMDQLGYY